MLKKMLNSFMLMTLICAAAHLISASPVITKVGVSLEACPGRTEIFTCNVTTGGYLQWIVEPFIQSSNPYTFTIADEVGLKYFRIEGFVAVLNYKFDQSDGQYKIASTLNITLESVAIQNNVITIECSDGMETANRELVISSPPPPPDLHYSVVSSDCLLSSVKIQWGPLKGAIIDNYTIDVLDGFDNSQPVTVVVTMHTHYTHTTKNGVSYTFKFTSANCAGLSYSNISLLTGCTNVTAPERGKIVSDICKKEGSMISYKCNEGLTPEGTRETVCTSGSWSEDPSEVVCSVDCGDPSHGSRVTVDQYDSTKENAIIYFQCKPGYLPQDGMMSVCTAMGNWIPDPRELDCKAECDTPSSPVNGMIQSHEGSLEGSQAVYSCDEGLYPCHIASKVCNEMVSDLTTVCTENGWSPNPANFECRKAVFCSYPTIPENATLIKNDSLIEGAVIVFHCNHGLFPEENIRAKCIGGHWDPDPAQVKCSKKGQNVTIISVVAVLSAVLSSIVATVISSMITRCILKKRRQEDSDTEEPGYDEIMINSRIEVEDNVAYAPGCEVSSS